MSTNPVRLTQTDPAGYDPSPNLYAYVKADPVNLADPSGHFWITICSTAFKLANVFTNGDSNGPTLMAYQYCQQVDIPDAAFIIPMIPVPTSYGSGGTALGGGTTTTPSRRGTPLAN